MQSLTLHSEDGLLDLLRELELVDAFLGPPPRRVLGPVCVMLATSRIKASSGLRWIVKGRCSRHSRRMMSRCVHGM